MNLQAQYRRIGSRAALIRSSSTAVANSNTNGGSSAIQRHGRGDGLLTLNVGGTKFQTLRSTVAQNDVLMDHVSRAERNAEISTGVGDSGPPAVFVDRDPKHFGMILAYLRNKADNVYRPSVKSTLLSRSGGNGRNAPTNGLSASSFIQLPKDSKMLTEMYFETLHYNIPELSDRICSQQGLTRIFDLFGSKNPFETASSVIVAGKRALVVLGTLMTSTGGWVYAQAVAAQAKTNELLAQGECTECGKNDGGTEGKSADYWKKQTEYWKGMAAKWSAGNADSK